MTASRLDLLLQFHAEDPEDAFTCFALAREYLATNEVDKARVHYEALVQMQPSYTGTYYHLGKLYQQLGRIEDAEQTFRSGIAVCIRGGAHKDLSELRQALDLLRDE